MQAVAAPAAAPAAAADDALPAFDAATGEVLA